MRGRFSESVNDCLLQAGWYEGRLIEHTLLEAYLDAHLQSDLYFLDVAKRCLFEFGDLNLHFPNRLSLQAIAEGRISKSQLKNKLVVEECLSFDPIMAMQCINPEWVRDYQKAVGLNLSVIGWIAARATLVLLDEHGRVYMGDSELFYKIAESVDLGIEALVQYAEPLKIFPVMIKGV
jgi:hypothetical protein